MGEEVTLETQKPYLGKEATRKLIEKIKSRIYDATIDKVSFGEQSLTTDQQRQVRDNIGIVQPDYSQNNELAPDYIKNRLAWSEIRKEHIFTLQTVEPTKIGPSDYSCAISISSPLEEGVEYIVSFDNIEYRCKCSGLKIEDEYVIYIGNATVYDIGTEDSREPFVIMSYPEYKQGLLATDCEGSFLLEIYKETEFTHSIDPKYLPDTVATKGDVEASKEEAVNAAKEYVDSQRLAYSDPEIVLMWDGDMSGAIDTGLENELLIKLYDKKLDLSKVSSISVVSDIFPDFEEFIVPLENLAIEIHGDIQILGGVADKNSPLQNEFGVISIGENAPAEYDVFGEGVYIPVSHSAIRISKIIFAETIHPINPKYLPQGGVGYVDTKTLDFDGDITEKEVCGTFVKVSDEAIDLHNVKTIVAMVCDDDYFHPVEIQPEDCVINVDELNTIMTHADGDPIAVCNESGTWFAYVGDESECEFYVSTVECIVDIHKIDQTYLPDTIATDEHIESVKQEARAYTDSKRIAYTENNHIVVAPRSDLTFIEELDGIYFYEFPTSFELSVGNEYVVNFDEMTYKFVAKYNEVDGETYLGVDTGNPFLVAIGVDGTCGMVTDTGGPHTAYIYQESEIIHRIDPKYLPEGGFGYEETTIAPGILKWDGDTTGKEVINSGEKLAMVRVSDTILDKDLYQGIEITLSLYDGGEQIQYYSKEERPVSADDGVYHIYDGNTPLVLSITEEFAEISKQEGYEVEPGIYCMRQSIDGGSCIYVSAIHGAAVKTEVTHRIDAKYLPSSCLTKTIDLTKYDADGRSLNHAIITAFSCGGGRIEIPNTEGTKAFWNDVSTGGRIQLMIDADVVKIVSDVKSTTYESDGKTLIAIETSFLIYSGGTTARVTVLLGNVSETTDVTVVVEIFQLPS